MAWKYANELKLYKKQSEIDQAYYDKQQKQLNQWNQESAQKQMDFQKMMSDTSHQREVNDLLKAGLNPVLSANNGASTPSGAYANVDSTPVSAAGSSRIANKQIAANMRMNEMSLANAFAIAKYQAQVQAAMQKYATDMNYKLGWTQAVLGYKASVYGVDQNVQNPTTAAGVIREIFNGASGNNSVRGAGKGLSGLWNSGKAVIHDNMSKAMEHDKNNNYALKGTGFDKFTRKIGNYIIEATKPTNAKDLTKFTGDIGYVPQGKVIGKDGKPTKYTSFTISKVNQHGKYSKAGAYKWSKTHKSTSSRW